MNEENHIMAFFGKLDFLWKVVESWNAKDNGISSSSKETRTKSFVAVTTVSFQPICREFFLIPYYYSPQSHSHIWHCWRVDLQPTLLDPMLVSFVLFLSAEELEEEEALYKYDFHFLSLFPLKKKAFYEISSSGAEEDKRNKCRRLGV